MARKGHMSYMMSGHQEYRMQCKENVTAQHLTQYTINNFTVKCMKDIT